MQSSGVRRTPNERPFIPASSGRRRRPLSLRAYDRYLGLKVRSDSDGELYQIRDVLVGRDEVHPAEIDEHAEVATKLRVLDDVVRHAPALPYCHVAGARDDQQRKLAKQFVGEGH